MLVSGGFFRTQTLAFDFNGRILNLDHFVGFAELALLPRPSFPHRPHVQLLDTLQYFSCGSLVYSHVLLQPFRNLWEKQKLHSLSTLREITMLTMKSSKILCMAISAFLPSALKAFSSCFHFLSTGSSLQVAVKLCLTL